MNVFVVGGAGFLGSHLVDRLLAEGHAVDVVDNLTSGSLSNLAEARAAGGALKIHHLDAATRETESSIGQRPPDVIYHLAVLPEHDVDDAASTGDSFASMLAILEAARRHGVAKVVVALPGNVLYGHPAAKDLPLKEGEPSQLVARGVRGVVARAIVDLLVTYRDLHAIEFAALAMTDVYGSRQRDDGGPVASMLAAERGGGLVINIGTGAQTTIGDLWDQIGRLVDGADGLEPVHEAAGADDLHRFALAPVRARIHLAWSPWTDLDEGLQRAVASS